MKEQGKINTLPKNQTRTVSKIIKDNAITLFNILNISIALIIIFVSYFNFNTLRFDFSEGLSPFRNILFLIVAFSSMLIGIFQEIRAKITVDKLSIITKPEINVLRDGAVRKIHPEELVLFDVFELSSGTQICADGEVIASQGLECDESLLTGESDSVVKKNGDRVMSGSFVVSGTGYVRAAEIGGDCYASRLISEAKKEKKTNSVILTAINKIINLLTIIIIPLGLLLFASKFFISEHHIKSSALSSSAAVIGMIPEGLILLTSIAFAVGVINLGKHKVLVQSLPCIESLARVDVLCLDKTGTITDGKLAVVEVLSLDDNKKDDIHRNISSVISLLNDNNATANALKSYFSEPDPTLSKNGSYELIPFSSKRKYSGVCFCDESTYLIGAAEFILKEIPQSLSEKISELTQNGLRVVIFAKAKSIHNNFTCLAIIAISDNLRPEAAAVIKYFKAQQVTLKIISGDNPSTVSAVAKRACVENSENYIDMSSVNNDASLNKIAEEYTVFGRVTPTQKKALIIALKENRHTVAMTGDGVNDVLALKEADCSVAMANGSAAVRSVSDIVLLNSNLASLIPSVYEGRRVIGNIGRVAALYLNKSIFSAILAFLFVFMPLIYPFVPIQLTAVSALTIGIPSFFLSLKPNRQRVLGNFLKKIYLTALPAAFSVAINIIVIEIISLIFKLSAKETSTLCTIMAACFGFMLLFKCSRPFDFKRIVLFTSMLLIFLTELIFFADFFEFANIFSKIAFVYIPLLALSYPLYLFIFKVIKRLLYLNRTHQKKKRKAGK